LEAVKQAETSALSELEQARRLAEREAKKAEREYEQAEAEIQANYVEVKAGYISKTDYNKLSDSDKALVKRVGVDKFNELKQARLTRAEARAETRTEAQLISFGVRNIKLNTGEYVSKVDFDKYDKTAQDYLKRYGVDKFNTWAKARAEAVTITTSGMVFSSPEVEADYYFKELQASGDIPKEATLEGYDEKTKEVSYTLPAPTLDDYVAKWRAAGMSEAELAVIYPLHKFADLITYTFADTDTRTIGNALRQTFSAERRKADPKGYWQDVGSLVAVTAIPFAWTKDIDKMSTHAIIANAAIDIAYIGSIVLGGSLRGLKTAKIMNTTKVAGKAAVNMDKALKELASTPIGSAKYAEIASKAQRAIQASSVADQKFIALLERTRLTASELGKLEKHSGIKGLKSAILEVNKAQVKLDKAWKPVKVLKFGGVKYIKQMTKVELAQGKLAKALELFNTKLEPRYKFSPTTEFKGFATEWRQKMLPIFIEGEPKVVPLTDRGKGVQLAVLEKTKPKVEIKTVHELRLKPVYTETVAPKPEVKPPKVKPEAKVKPEPMIKTVSTTRVKTEAGYEPGYAERMYEKPDIQELAQQVTEVIGIPLEETGLRIAGKPAIQLTPAQLTKTNVKLHDITREAIKAANKAIEANKTKEQVKQAVKASVKAQVKTITQTKVKQAVKTKVKMIVRTVVKMTTRIRIPPPEVNLPDGTKHTLTESELKGAVAWKQGFIYKMIFPPYGANQIVNTRQPIAGVRVVEGARSAYETIVRLGGILPATIRRDMGIMDIEIKTTRGGQPRIAFTPDIRQLTTSTHRIRKRANTSRRRPKTRQTTPALITARW